MARRKWRDLVNEMDAARPGRAEERAVVVAQLRAEEERYQHTLTDLRKARSLTQVDVAGALGMTQPEVSKLERRTDLYLSTLEKYVRGLGGRLELTAVFGNERFDLKLQDLVLDKDGAEPDPEVTAGTIPYRPNEDASAMGINATSHGENLGEVAPDPELELA